MGCCAIKDDNLNDRNLNIIDFTKKRVSNYNSDITVFASGFQDKTPISMELARNFFKQKNATTSSEGNLASASEGFKINDGLAEARKALKGGEDDEFNEKKNFEEEKRGEKKDSNKLLNKEVISYPRLEFSVMNTRLNNLPTEKIILTPNTINGSLRKIGEKLFFGRTPPATLKKYPSTHLGLNMPRFSSTSLNTRPNDYDFSDESIGPRQFEISFVKEKEKFYVADNKRGTGLFVKIKQSVIVDHDMIVSFCASHMILQIESEMYHPENKIIKIRFLQGPHQNQEKVFNSKDKKIIRIGRSKQAEVVYKDDSVSRIQCTVVFEKGNWNLYDGYLDNGNKGSTNGLWLLASSKIELTNEMVLKTGNTVLVVKLRETE